MAWKLVRCIPTDSAALLTFPSNRRKAWVRNRRSRFKMAASRACCLKRLNSSQVSGIRET